MGLFKKKKKAPTEVDEAAMCDSRLKEITSTMQSSVDVADRHTFRLVRFDTRGRSPATTTKRAHHTR
jgi:hypothetical protein